MYSNSVLVITREYIPPVLFQLSPFIHTHPKSATTPLTNEQCRKAIKRMCSLLGLFFCAGGWRGPKALGDLGGDMLCHLPAGERCLMGDRLHVLNSLLGPCCLLRALSSTLYHSGDREEATSVNHPVRKSVLHSIHQSINYPVNL